MHKFGLPPASTSTLPRATLPLLALPRPTMSDPILLRVALDVPLPREFDYAAPVSLPAGSPAGDEQRARLRSEGVSIHNERVDMRRHGWR